LVWTLSIVSMLAVLCFVGTLWQGRLARQQANIARQQADYAEKLGKMRRA
jgi:hypothetical protein